MRVILFLYVVFFVPLLSAQTIKVATFNVSMEATNYQGRMSKATATTLIEQLKAQHPQINNIAKVIKTVRPDIILLNEFDFIANASQGVDVFNEQYLNRGEGAINYPFRYIAPVNTGVSVPHDLNKDGRVGSLPNDAHGFGFFPGHYGMAVLSRFPLDNGNIRTFQHFKWADLPNAQKPITPNNHVPWYSKSAWRDLRLHSKSLWDIPVIINDKRVHIIALHPTPPVFDGPENRNGKRNADEIRFVADYISPARAHYIYDDQGNKGGLNPKQPFIIMGDLNAADIGDKHRAGVIEVLTQHPRVNASIIPVSQGGAQSSSLSYSNRFTTDWGARVDYVLPSINGISVSDAGVFWPTKGDPHHPLVESRSMSSDHRLVWLELTLN